MERTQRKQDPEWGPYLSNRQWGTVREDTSHDGNAWECISYEEACSTVYRWGEDGLFGYSDRDCHLCMCLALWNGEDHILKERLFGLTGPQGNHGEDIKELLYYLDGTPDHSYMKALYKYPYSFPYGQLVEENKKKGRGNPEYEIMDTGLFDRNEYFDIQVEYATKDFEKTKGRYKYHEVTKDLYCCYTITNQGDVERELWVIPQFWFRYIIDIGAFSWKAEIIRQAYAGLFWNKQFYRYNVQLSNDPGNPENGATVKPLTHKVIDKSTYSEEDGNWQRAYRNKDWETLDSYDIISMPDKWEFPWFASWDLAFQMIPYARVDPEFAEQQMLLLLSSRYMHPNGQIPGCEWGMESVFPPVHAWSCLQIHRIRLAAGKEEIDFLVPCFEALRKNFDWWMNAMKFKDSHLFSGGFLGMDNISVVDRSYVLSKGYPLQQADATGWMAMFALNMVEMAMCICKCCPVYGKYTVMYLNHFLCIAESLNTSINKGGLWDPHDKFYYDVCLTKTRRVPIRVRSLVGIVPLFAGMEIKDEDLNHCRRLSLFLKQRQTTSRFIERRSYGYHISAVPKDRIGHLVRVLSDQEEFLSQYGVRSLSKVYKEDPYILHLDKELRESLCVKGDKLELSFSPGESETGMFGGNSNWRGPVWLCILYTKIVQKYHRRISVRLQIQYVQNMASFDLGFPFDLDFLDSDDETEELLSSIDITAISSVNKDNMDSVLSEPALQGLPPPETPASPLPITSRNIEPSEGKPKPPAHE
ncbi:hypothetical protein FSP39_012521 [Pinctada imbricata]|uniref:Mannosylglycerate hydrolase MGH1-like glycoside hydrolase domain-containing protein n=1 Tax=Pinctada imbricata TaxID=66713 RepID=A0AA88XFJ2_PINIB|nr:hypothetical protein FSP39_012521 [Pinctada imbricata]